MQRGPVQDQLASAAEPEPDAGRDTPPDAPVHAAELAQLPGGIDLAAVVGQIRPAEVDESVVMELIAGCERLKSWAAATQARCISELHTRTAGQAAPVFVDDQIRMRLAITGTAAGLMETRARELADHPEVHTALQAGWIDVGKAQVFTDVTSTLPGAQARAIHRMFLPQAADLTTSQLRKKLTAAALAIDPDLAAQRHQKAKDTRTVSLTPARDGMAWLSIFLPAPEALAAFTAIDHLAGNSSPDDPRTIGARRADAFTKVFTDILTTGTTPSGCALPTRQGTRPHLMVTVAASTLAGTDNALADLAGYGPITADMARDIADQDAQFTTIITDDDGTYTGQHPGPPHPANPSPTPSGHPAPQNPGPGPGPGPGPANPHGGSLRGRVQLSAHNARYLIELINTCGAKDPVAYLHRLGLIAANSYHPSAQLRRHLIARDRTCRFPGCHIPATSCQIDHIHPFTTDLPPWAQTIETNLHLLCRHHHQLKTAKTWRVWRDQHGTTHWISPWGFHRTRPPESASPRDETALLNIALAGLKAELGETITDLTTQAPTAPGTADDEDPSNLASEHNLETIARRLTETTGTGPNTKHTPQQSKNAPPATTARPQGHPPPGRTPRRTPPPQTGPSEHTSDTTDEDDRPPF